LRDDLILLQRVLVLANGAVLQEPIEFDLLSRELKVR
jgi:hypothetical protein